MLLRNPRFGNTYSLDTGVTIRRTLNGELIVDAHRNQLYTLHLEFEALTQGQRDSLIDFFINVAGQVVALKDHEGFNWSGVFSDSQPVLVCNGPGCLYSGSMQFQGHKI